MYSGGSEMMLLAFGLLVNGMGLCCIGAAWITSTAVRARRRTLGVVREEIKIVRAQFCAPGSGHAESRDRKVVRLLEEEAGLIELEGEAEAAHV